MLRQHVYVCLVLRAEGLGLWGLGHVKVRTKLFDVWEGITAPTSWAMSLASCRTLLLVPQAATKFPPAGLGFALSPTNRQNNP